MIADASIANPYVGPRTFSYEQRHLFFGREREARDLLARVLSERLLLFYAQSGAGKSSLLYARLIPQLQEEKGFVVLPVGRVGGELPAGIKQADNIYSFNLMLSIDAGNDPARLAHVTLSDFLARLARRTVTDAAGQERKGWVYDASLAPAPAAAGASTRRYALIIDQFEEIITAHPGLWREREEFFRQLDSAMQADPSLWVVLTLREDYVASLDPYASLMADRLRARFYMERMGADAALAAIRRPAELAGRPFAEGVAEQLAEDLRQVRVPGQQKTIPGQYVEPVQLQVACYQLWENITGRPTGPITAQDLAEAGDVNQALSRFYEQTLQDVLADPAAISVSERQLRTWFDKELITADGTRDLVRQGEEVTGNLPNAVVGQLQKRFLVRAEARGGDTWIELVHDRFIEPIRQSNRAWFARNLNLLTLAARAWQEAGRPESKLYVGSQLAAAAAQLQANPAEFGEAERNFLEEGQKAEARRVTRRQQRITWGAAALALVFIALAVWALWSRGEARTSAAAAVDARTTAEADRIRAVTAEAEAVDQSLAAQDARDTAIFLQGRERNARSEAEANATAAIAAKATAEAASTQAVASAGTAEAERAIAQAANTAQVKALNDLAANLQANLTAQAIAMQPSLTATETPGPTPSGTPTLPAVVPGTPPPPAIPTATRTVTPPPTPNRTVIAQQTQLAQVRATQTALAPPSGRIVFVSTRDNPRGDLYIMRVDGQDMRRLTNIGAYEVSYTEANEGQLVFSARPGERVSIYRSPISAGAATNLTGFDSDNWEPAFSKNGQRIAFVSSREPFDWEIYVMNSDGTRASRLTNDDPARNTMPTWSPDGSQIAFVTVEGCGRPSCPSAIRVFTSDGTNIRPLVYFEGKIATHPAWSPDGGRIAFASDRDGSTDIFVVDANGTNVRNLTNSSYDENHPAWSLEGRWIAFTRYTDNTEIFIMTADGARVTQVTNDPAGDWYPVWVR